MGNELRDEVVDEIYDFENEISEFKIFKPIKTAWRALVKACQPIFEFHDKYILYVLNAILFGGTFLVVLYVYLRR